MGAWAAAPPQPYCAVPAELCAPVSLQGLDTVCGAGISLERGAVRELVSPTLRKLDRTTGAVEPKRSSSGRLAHSCGLCQGADSAQRGKCAPGTWSLQTREGVLQGVRKSNACPAPRADLRKRETGDSSRSFMVYATLGLQAWGCTGRRAKSHQRRCEQPKHPRNVGLEEVEPPREERQDSSRLPGQTGLAEYAPRKDVAEHPAPLL